MTARRIGDALTPVVSSVLAAIVALMLGGVFLWLRGKDPWTVYRLMYERGPGADYGLSESAIRMAPLLIIGAGLLVSLRAGVWNIGIDGQFLLGAFMTGVITQGAGLLRSLQDQLQVGPAVEQSQNGSGQ